MTSVIFNDPSGSDYLYKFSGVQLNAPSGETLALGANAKTADNSNVILTVGDSYIRIPQGVSAERPATGYAGMIRYLTTDNIIEYFDANLQQWNAISQPPPVLSGVSPAFFNIGVDASNSFSLTGSNFGLTGASIVAIGNNGSGTIINPTVSSVLTESSAVVQFDASATQNLTDISNQLSFAIRITNNNSGLSSLLQNAITNANVGPIVIQPNPQTVPFQTFPVQDPSASFTLIGEDESSPPHYPFESITITSGTAGNINDVSFVEPSGAIISVPSGQRSSAVAGNYPFNVKLVDASGASVTTTLTLALADPVVSSVVPFAIDAGTVDLSVNGNYFVNDSGVSYVKQIDGSVVTTTTTYNSKTSLETNVTFPANNTESDIFYDISVNNGSVFKLYTSVLTVKTKFIQFSYLQTSGTSLTPSITYEDSGNNPVGSPVAGGYTVVKFVPTSTDYTQNYQWDISFSNTTSISEILVVGGGGCGSNDTNNTQGNGGGGAGGFRETNSLGYSFTQGTNYVVQCGRPGQQRPTGSQTWANGQITINTAPTGGDTTRAAYASGISTGSTNIYVASGGGNGGYYSANPGGNGGSGGGAGRGGSGGTGNIGSYTPSEGNSGVGSGSFGGGGGGAGAAGSGQNGGNGKASTYFGGTYAGGGGGSGSTYGSGGTGGGGSGLATGSTSYLSGFWGTPGTGGGGGASSNFPSSPGGSGRVEFRFLSFSL